MTSITEYKGYLKAFKINFNFTSFSVAANSGFPALVSHIFCIL